MKTVSKLCYQVKRVCICMFIALPVTCVLLCLAAIGTVIPPLQESIGAVGYPVAKWLSNIEDEYNL